MFNQKNRFLNLILITKTNKNGLLWFRIDYHTGNQTETKNR